MEALFFLLLHVVIPSIPLAILVYIAYYKLKIKLIEGLVYSRAFSETDVFEGDEVEVIETIYNPSVFPVFWVDVESYIHGALKLENRSDTDGMQLIVSRFHLPPFTRIVRRHTVKCRRRGYYTMNSACVMTTGIRIDQKKYFEFESELYVYPKILEYRQLSHPIRFMSGNSITRHRAMRDPFSVVGVRDYASGDPFNTINFKVTARSSYGSIPNIKVNQYDNCSDRIFMIYINFQPSADGVATDEYESLMEYGMSLAASFASEALKNGYKVGFAANCRKVTGELKMAFPMSGGAYHIEEMLREMAQAQILYGISFTALLEEGVESNIRGTEVFVLTPYVDENMDECVAMLGRNNHVTVIEL